MNNNILDKVNNFFDKNLEKSVQNVIILQDEFGNYELFNNYHLTNTNDTVTVSCKYSHTVKEFSSLPVAVAWCIFDKRNKIYECTRIEYLDQMLLGVKSSILLHEKIITKSNDRENKFILLSKLSQDQHKKQKVLTELKKFIKESKIWQLRQFNQI